MNIEYTYDVFDSINDRWPKLGDRLFVVGRDAMLAQDAPERTYRLTRGYKCAGDILIQTALEDAAQRHNLVFPILFCYRHYIEIALKDIIDQYAPIERKKNHDLRELWVQFTRIAETYGNDMAGAASVVAACVEELASVDAGSFTFRYALSQRGTLPALPSDELDLVNLHGVMNGIENFLECADLDFDHKSTLS